MATRSSPHLSFVVPVYNEKKNLPALREDILRAMEIAGVSFEVIIVDDGSIDGSRDAIREICRTDGRFRAVFFDGNYGQTSGYDAGFKEAGGGIVVTLDADLQVRAADALPLIGKLDGGYDAVVGYRAARSDSIVKRLSSIIANAVRNRFTGERIRDVGCPLKVFRREALAGLTLYDGMHRFLPTLLTLEGRRVAEAAVPHYPRVHGESKYTVGNRLFRALRDLFAVRWMKSRYLRYRIEERISR